MQTAVEEPDKVYLYKFQNRNILNPFVFTEKLLVNVPKIRREIISVLANLRFQGLFWPDPVCDNYDMIRS